MAQLTRSPRLDALPAPALGMASLSARCQPLAQRSAPPARRAVAQAATLSLTYPVSSSMDAADAPAGPFNSGERNAGGASTSGGSVTSIHAPEELYAALEANQDKLVCLMCKATGCRPCKMFARKYKRLAASLPECLFLEVTGDETNALRKMMIQMNVRATPTFRIYKGGECVKTTTGIDEAKLRTAIDECLAGKQGESDL